MWPFSSKEQSKDPKDIQRIGYLDKFFTNLKQVTIPHGITSTIVLTNEDFELYFPKHRAANITDYAFIGEDNSRGSYIKVCSEFQWTARKLIDQEVERELRIHNLRKFEEK